MPVKGDLLTKMHFAKDTDTCTVKMSAQYNCITALKRLYFRIINVVNFDHTNCRRLPCSPEYTGILSFALVSLLSLISVSQRCVHKMQL